MWSRIENYVKKYNMIRTGDHILLGLSGGPDSILLARYLIEVRERGEISLAACHVNHQLRGTEAVRDEEFAREFCDRWQIPCHIFREDVRGYAGQGRCSLEEAGRILRYQRFFDCAEKTGCHKTALAHHADDLAETMIFRMIRGTGPEGLPGILPVNGRFIRPLLFLGKEEILQMLGELSQDYVEDSSNEDTGYSRNYIRRQIMPGLKELNPRAVRHLAALSGQIQEQNDYIRIHFDRLYHRERIPSPEGVRMSLSFLRDCDGFSQKEIIRRMLFEATGRRKDIAALHVTLVQELTGNTAGKKLDLPYGLTALMEEEYLYLFRDGRSCPQTEHDPACRTGRQTYRVDKEKLEAGQTVTIDVGGGEEYRFDLIAPAVCPDQESQKNDCAGYFNYDRIKNELFLRTRKEGDYFVMDRQGRKKLLRRYFIDQKIAADRRDEIFLLAEEDHILWLSTGRTSEAYKVTDRTGQVLRVICKKTDGGNERHE